MPVLSDRAILAHSPALVEPFVPSRVQPASYDLTLAGPNIFIARGGAAGFNYDIKRRAFCYVMDGMVKPYDTKNMFDEYPLDNNKGYVLAPGEFAIATTRETLHIPHDLMARVEGKSTLGRNGLLVHVTAGYIDPGFDGQLTLELANLAPWGIRLRDGDAIAQMSFHKMDSPVMRPYGKCGNHYQGQRGPTLGR